MPGCGGCGCSCCGCGGCPGCGGCGMGQSAESSTSSDPTGTSQQQRTVLQRHLEHLVPRLQVAQAACRAAAEAAVCMAVVAAAVVAVACQAAVAVPVVAVLAAASVGVCPLMPGMPSMPTNMSGLQGEAGNEPSGDSEAPGGAEANEKDTQGLQVLDYFMWLCVARNGGPQVGHSMSSTRPGHFTESFLMFSHDLKFSTHGFHSCCTWIEQIRKNTEAFDKHHGYSWTEHVGLEQLTSGA
eukprot:s946_g15.t1